MSLEQFSFHCLCRYIQILKALIFCFIIVSFPAAWHIDQIFSQALSTSLPNLDFWCSNFVFRHTMGIQKSFSFSYVCTTFFWCGSVLSYVHDEHPVLPVLFYHIFCQEQRPTNLPTCSKTFDRKSRWTRHFWDNKYNTGSLEASACMFWILPRALQDLGYLLSSTQQPCRLLSTKNKNPQQV